MHPTGPQASAGLELVLGRHGPRVSEKEAGQLGRCEGIWPMANKNWKSLFNFQIFSKFQTNLNSNQI
jgi:hypothetical protein